MCISPHFNFLFCMCKFNLCIHQFKELVNNLFQLFRKVMHRFWLYISFDALDTVIFARPLPCLGKYISKFIVVQITNNNYIHILSWTHPINMNNVSNFTHNIWIWKLGTPGVMSIILFNMHIFLSFRLFYSNFVIWSTHASNEKNYYATHK